MLLAHEEIEIPEFVAGVEPFHAVPVEKDPQHLNAEEFAAKYGSQCVLLRGAAAHSRALQGWTNEFFEFFGGERVKIRSTRPHDAVLGWTIDLLLADFMKLVESTSGVYLAEWYFFIRHPEYLADITDALPAYLLDDWLELLPPGWALGAQTRNNIFWGAHASYTSCHWDAMAAQVWNATLRGTKRWLLFDASNLPGQAMRNLVAPRLIRDGIMTLDGCLTTEGIRRWIEHPPDGVPPPKFFAVDVQPGDVLHVPSRWAHQVHNIGETLAVSRYYVNALNFERLLGTLKRAALPSVVPAVVRGLLGDPRRRDALRSSTIRRLLGSETMRKAFHALLRHTSLYAPVNHYLQ